MPARSPRRRMTHPGGQSGSQAGSQRPNCGPLWFVQVTATHNATPVGQIGAARPPGGILHDAEEKSADTVGACASRGHRAGRVGRGTNPVLAPRAHPAPPHHPFLYRSPSRTNLESRGARVSLDRGQLKRGTLELLTMAASSASSNSQRSGAQKTNNLNHVKVKLQHSDGRSSASTTSTANSSVKNQLHRAASQSTLRSLEPGNSVAHRDSFHGAMCPALVVAQCFALLPVDGISRTHPGVPQFRWLSARVFYTVAVFLGTSVVAMLAAYRMVYGGLSFYSSVNVVFFGNSVSAMVLFLQLGTRWPGLARAWARIEQDMRPYGYPRHLGRKMKIMTAVVLLLAAVEHILAVMTGVYSSWPCYESGGLSGLMRGYTINNFAMVLQVTEYAPWKAVFVFLLNVVATFSWNYTDLFIMLLSVSLAQRFKQLNHRLRAVKGKNLPSGVWRQLRETYNALACLTKTVDSCVRNIVLLSFASNLYFICIQLLQGMKPILDVYHYVYFFYSFGYLLLRTCVVSLYAASIHDESKEPKSVLFSVPSESFCIEVAGTIVTYEIVLVQFNGVTSDGSSGNSTIPTPNTTVTCY